MTSCDHRHSPRVDRRPCSAGTRCLQWVENQWLEFQQVSNRNPCGLRGRMPRMVSQLPAASASTAAVGDKAQRRRPVRARRTTGSRQPADRRTMPPPSVAATFPFCIKGLKWNCLQATSRTPRLRSTDPKPASLRSSHPTALTIATRTARTHAPNDRNALRSSSTAPCCDNCVGVA